MRAHSVAVAAFLYEMPESDEAPPEPRSSTFRGVQWWDAAEAEPEHERALPAGLARLAAAGWRDAA